MTRTTMIVAAAAALLLSPVSHADDDRFNGRWRFVDDGVLIDLARCDQAWCAQIVGISPKETDPAKQKDCGHRVLDAMRPESDSGSLAGWTIDPSNGKRYRATLQPDAAAADRLVLKVQALGGLVHQSFVLQRAGTAVGNCPTP